MTIESILDEALSNWVRQGYMMLRKQFPTEKAEPKVALYNISHRCSHPSWISYYEDKETIMLNHLKLEQFYNDEGRERTVALLTYLILGTFIRENYSLSDKEIAEATKQLMNSILPDWELLLRDRLKSLEKNGLDESFVR